MKYSPEYWALVVQTAPVLLIAALAEIRFIAKRIDGSPLDFADKVLLFNLLITLISLPVSFVLAFDNVRNQSTNEISNSIVKYSFVTGICLICINAIVALAARIFVKQFLWVYLSILQFKQFLENGKNSNGLNWTKKRILRNLGKSELAVLEMITDSLKLLESAKAHTGPQKSAIVKRISEHLSKLEKVKKEILETYMEVEKIYESKEVMSSATKKMILNKLVVKFESKAIFE